ncbi:MAG: metal-dependent hydrolase [Methylococcales bacterium]|nr:metal-dependent hydrolase [Methylococcales bacterium]
MANFNTHVTIATVASTSAALLAAKAHLITNADMAWLIFLGTLGGMLPDIDASNSRPVKLLFTLLALMGAGVTLQVFKDNNDAYELMLIIVGTYVLIRHGMFALFNRLTVHRGVFHSLLAALFFAFFMACVSFHFLHWNALHAWLNGIFTAIGFIVHLLLDEIFSVDLLNARMKKSFGTALKLCSYDNLIASILMAICTLLLYWVAPPTLPFVKVWKNSHFQPLNLLE